MQCTRFFPFLLSTRLFPPLDLYIYRWVYLASRSSYPLPPLSAAFYKHNVIQGSSTNTQSVRDTPEHGVAVRGCLCTHGDVEHHLRPEHAI